MKAFILALLTALTACTASAQVTLLRSAIPYKAKQFHEAFADPIIMPKVEVKTWQESKSGERLLLELERRFTTPKRTPDVVFVQSTEPAPSGHSLQDSTFFDFGMMGKDLKSLKGGFELWGMDFYIKSGLAWHPGNNKYVTLRLGKKSSWSYRFRNGHDLLKYNFQRPLEKFNERILERPIYSLFDRLGF